MQPVVECTLLLLCHCGSIKQDDPADDPSYPKGRAVRELNPPFPFSREFHELQQFSTAMTNKSANLNSIDNGEGCLQLSRTGGWTGWNR